jgi:hypothetical protein
MSVKLYFEALTRGMRAKLDTRYRAGSDVITYNRTDYLTTVRRQNLRTGFLSDAIKMPHDRIK